MNIELLEVQCLVDKKVIKESLARIGIADKKRKILYPSVYLYEKDGKDYLCHGAIVRIPVIRADIFHQMEQICPITVTEAAYLIPSPIFIFNSRRSSPFPVKCCFTAFEGIHIQMQLYIRDRLIRIIYPVSFHFSCYCFRYDIQACIDFISGKAGAQRLVQYNLGK